jgi:hypothetical protein
LVVQANYTLDVLDHCIVSSIGTNSVIHPGTSHAFGSHLGGAIAAYNTLFSATGGTTNAAFYCVLTNPYLATNSLYACVLAPDTGNGAYAAYDFLGGGGFNKPYQMSFGIDPSTTWSRNLVDTNFTGSLFPIPPADQVSGIQLSGTNVVITIPSMPDETYQLQFTADLASGNWSNIVGLCVSNGIGGLMTLTNVGAALAPQGFYRFDITP